MKADALGCPVLHLDADTAAVGTALLFFFFKQKTAYEITMTGVQTCALPILLGGSQGAKALNDVVLPALAPLAREGHPLTILHQAGRDRDGEVRASYQSLGAAQMTVVP